MKHLYFFLCIMLVGIGIAGCTTPVVKSGDKAITAFGFSNPVATGIITESTHSIRVAVRYGTDKTSLVPNIVTTGVSVSPASGVAADFTDPVAYTVTAEDGTTQVYAVTVSVMPQILIP